MQPGGSNLGPVGVWAFQFSVSAFDEAREWAREVDQLGYGAIWIPEAGVRDPFVTATALLAVTQRVVLATGIASIWARPAYTMAAAHQSLEAAFPGRFLLGLGVSHEPAVKGFFRTEYQKPYTTMVEYLAAMDRVAIMATPGPNQPQKVLAALGPKMLALAGSATAGAHPYNVTPEHTAEARAILGPEPFLAVEHAVCLTTDAHVARASGRRHLSMYLGLPNYRNNIHRLGFTEADTEDGGSDRLVDALVAWGSEAEIAEKVGEHHAAGADHVCIQVLPNRDQIPLDVWRALAPALLDES